MKVHGTRPRRLVVLGSSLTALAVVRVAARTGFECVMLDDRKGPACGTRMARFQLLPTETKSDVTESILRQWCEGALLIVDSDRWLRYLLDHVGDLERIGYRVLHPSPALLRICLDKTAFLEWCANAQVPAPRLYHRDDQGGYPGVVFPVLLRPQQTQHSVATGLPKAVEASDSVQFGDWLSRFAAAGVEPNVCQSLLRPGLRQFSVGAARDGAGRIVTLLAEKLRPQADQCAGGTYVRKASFPGVEDLAAAVLDRLDFFGVAEVEVLCDPQSGRAWIVEVNARPWLQFGLPYAGGIDLLGHLVGDEPAVTKMRRDPAWIHFWADAYACFSRSSGLLRMGRLTAREYFASLLAANVHALWAWADPWPFLQSVWGSTQTMLRGRRA